MGSPIVTPTITKYLLLNSTISASELFTVTDPDGDAVTRYRFGDSSTNAVTGYFRLKGVPQPNGSSFIIAANELSDLLFVAGSQVGSESISISAKDLSNFGNTANFQIFFVRPNVTAPTLTTRSIFLLQNESILLSDIIVASDPDGWPIKTYFLRDSNGGAYSGFFQNSNGVLPQTVAHYLPDTKYASTVYTAQLANEVERIYANVYDGVQWGSPNSFTITTRPNVSRPIAQFGQLNAPVDRTIFVGDAFRFFDGDGNTAKQFQFYDTNSHASSGALRLGGQTFKAKEWVTVNAADMASLRYSGADSNILETFRFRVFDGRYWSPIQDFNFNNLVRPILNYDPLLHDEDLKFRDFSSTFFTKGDTGPNYGSFQVIDRDANANSGRLLLNGAVLNEGQIYNLSPVDFQNLKFQTGRYGNRELDTILFRVNNGTFWSDWEKVEYLSEPEYRTALRAPNGSLDNGLNDWKDWIDVDPTAVAQTITFSFMQTWQDHPTPDGASAANWSPFTAAQRDGARFLLNHVSEIFNLNFVEVQDSQTYPDVGRGGIIRMANYFNPPPDAGSGVLSGYSFAPQELATVEGGDIWINSAFVDIFNGWTPGSASDSYAFLITLLGGSLGLIGPGGVPGGVLPNETSNARYTLMAGPGNFNPGTFMLYDILALHDLYGANMSTRTGDDVYSLNNTWFNDQAMFWTIWDAGGNDTLSAEGSLGNNIVIDLREGFFSSIGTGIRNITIAFNCEIENAIGSNRNDTIRGNALNNVLNSGVGNDSIWSNGGNDLMLAGAGDDTYIYEVGDDHDTIDERQLTGRDQLVIQAFPTLNSFSADLSFRREFRDLIIDLTIDGGEADGSIRIKDQRWGGSRVETLVFGNQSIDLSSVYDQTTTANQSFQITNNSSAFGFLVTPV